MDDRCIKLRRHKSTRDHCIYCGTRDGKRTADHVPPKAFFQDPLPNGINRITVPCCFACRKRDQSDDDLMRDIFSSFEKNIQEHYVKAHIHPRRNRSWEKGHNVAELFQLFKGELATAPGDKVVNEIWLLPSNNLKLRRFLERTGRAMLFELQGVGYFEAEFDFKEMYFPDVVYKGIAQYWSLFRIPRVFACSASNLIGDSEYYVIANFFDGIQFVLKFQVKSFSQSARMQL